VWYHSKSEQVPSNIVLVGEIKTTEALYKPHSLGQFVTYLHQVIKSSPFRTTCYGFLTDGYTISFVRASYSENSQSEDPYTYEVTEYEKFIDIGGKHLLSLLHSDPANLGWSIPLLKPPKNIMSDNISQED